ncbi:MAG: twin-arginine translocase TatA/TatE family subunit [Actinobacteria bacterium]|jgi:sec-independent protein translocase protein TatA|nr:twin-arginine translocase TatA/TatE family subunit [Actinomycetota bacterium]
MGNLFHGPTPWILLFVVLLLFGAPKLPALAKSLGQSMKILKKEVSTPEAEKQAASEDAASAAPAAQTPAAAPAAPSVEDELAKAKAEAAAAKAEADALRAAAEQRAEGKSEA